MTHWLFIRLARSALVLLAVVSGNVLAAIFTVGTGAGCSHGTIQSAIDAANAAPGADTVRLTRSLTYEPEANTINATENLNLVGGFATCTQTATDNFKTTVSGAGGAAAPVFQIQAGTGTVIKLRHLTITNGDEDGAGYGGGILFFGDGVLEIIETDITNNTAGYGGGIYAEATGSNAELIINNNTTISGNTARYSGGGLYLAGPLEMTMTTPSSIIAFNEALGLDGFGGYGGGIHVNGPAIAYISSFAFGLGTIYGNSAVDGGGISIISGSADGRDALVHLYTTDPLQPVTVRGNFASDTGGGIYLQSYEGFLDSSTASLCASDFRIDDNAAQDGSAIYQNSDTFDGTVYNGGSVHLNDPDPLCTRPGLRCANGLPCNTLHGNDAVTADGQATNGATIRLLQGAYLRAKRLDMRANRGAYAIRSGDGYGLNIADCLLADNQLTQQLLRTEGEGGSYIRGCTFTHNAIASTDVIHAEGALQLTGSIIDQPGNLALAYSGFAGGLVVSNVLSSDLTTLPSDPSIISGDPSFVDTANGNYHLCLSSLAIDFAPPVTGDDRDLDNQPRDQDMSTVPNVYGVRDLGAYERQSALPADCALDDTIFDDGFESL